MFNIQAPDLYKLFKVTSPRVVNGIEKISSMNTPYHVADIPRDTLAHIYTFLENYNTDTDFELMQGILSPELNDHIAYEIDYLYETLILTHYIPPYLLSGFEHTLQFIAASNFIGNLPHPHSRIIRRILFRESYTQSLNEELQRAFRRLSSWRWPPTPTPSPTPSPPPSAPASPPPPQPLDPEEDPLESNMPASA